MSTRTATALVVEPDSDLRDQIGALVEQEGYDVLACPGPSAPGYECVGVNGPGCPLVAHADAVILDMSLDSDLALEGATAVELLTFYLSEGKAVVALLRAGADSTHPFAEERLATLRWPEDRRDLIFTLRHLVPSKWMGLGPSARMRTAGGL